jgi:hypothetical protein
LYKNPRITLREITLLESGSEGGLDKLESVANRKSMIHGLNAPILWHSFSRALITFHEGEGEDFAAPC